MTNTNESSVKLSNKEEAHHKHAHVHTHIDIQRRCMQYRRPTPRNHLQSQRQPHILTITRRKITTPIAERIEKYSEIKNAIATVHIAIAPNGYNRTEHYVHTTRNNVTMHAIMHRVSKRDNMISIDIAWDSDIDRGICNNSYMHMQRRSEKTTKLQNGDVEHTTIWHAYI